MFRRSFQFFAITLLCAGSAGAATLPANFYETIIHNGTMLNPTAMAIAPDGRVFVCQQDGVLRVIKNGALLAGAFFTKLPATISMVGERGLLGVAFDPNFTGNRYVYIYATHIQATGSVTFAGATTVSGPVTYNRVTRLTADLANPDVALAGSEVVILNMYPLTAATNHNGGAMHFGNDGKLYIAVGENASGPNSQTLANLLGKILRVNVDGSVPADNPFYATAVLNNRAIWSMGLRNPFTFAFQEPTGRMFINDVGQATWEEINDGLVGANYGWPGTEGGFVPASFPTYTHPTYYYSSVTGPCAITGGDFYDAAMFPAPYPGKYFYADYCAGWIRYITPPSAGVTLDPAAFTGFATGYTSPVGLETGPDGALYVLTGANSGTGRVYRIHYSTSAAPVISTQPESVTVTAGLNASFAVVSAGAAPITYQWVQNGVTLVGNSPSYTLNNAQLSNNGDIFRVVISNAAGTITSNPATLFVTTNTPPVPTIVLPTVGTMFNAGTTLTFSGSATDTQDGPLGPLAFTWWIDLHHDVHTHPAMSATYGVTTGTFVIPNQGETSDNIWYRVYLAVVDSGGMAVTVTRDINPNKTDMVFLTNPPVLDVTLEGIPLTTPATVVSVRGMIRDLGATSPQGAYLFINWSDGGAQSHFVTVGAVTVTYTANFALPTPTFTRTFTRTFTPTNTPTFTRTFTPSFTATFTPSFTRTFTATFTRTFTPSATPSSTPSFTPTNTFGLTNTPSFTPTFTRTFTPTFTRTFTPTFTRTFTPTLTGSFTPSFTASSSPTFTRTSTPTFTRTFTPTFTATYTPAFTRTFTHTFTRTFTPTFTGTFTPSFTPTSTGTASPTATPTLTSTFTRTFTPSFTATFTASFTSTFTRTFTGTFTRTFTPSATPSQTPSFTPTSTGTFTSTSSQTFTPTASATASQTSTASFTPTGTPSSTPSGTPTQTPTATPSSTASSTPTTTSTFTQTPSPTITDTGTLSPTFTSTITPTPTDTLTPTDTPTFTPSPTVTDTFTATNSPTPSLTPTSTGTFTPSPTATFTPSHTMTFTLTPTATVSPTFTPTSAIFDVNIAAYTAGGVLAKDILTLNLTGPITVFTLVPDATISSLNDPVYVDVQGTSIATWDGTDQAGNPVGNGAYNLRVENVNGGVTTVLSQAVTVSRTIYIFTVNILNSAGVTVRNLYSFMDDPYASDPLAGLQLSGSVLDTGAAGTVGISNSMGVTLVWDGRNNAANFVTPGCYYVDAQFNNGSSVSSVILPLVVVSGPGPLPTCAPVPAPPATPGTIQFDPPYPNPASDPPLYFSVGVSGQSTVKWSVFTLSFRKIFEGGTSVNSSQTLAWDLRDKWGTPAANGLYYLKVEVEGPLREILENMEAFDPKIRPSAWTLPLFRLIQ